MRKVNEGGGPDRVRCSRRALQSQMPDAAAPYVDLGLDNDRSPSIQLHW